MKFNIAVLIQATPHKTPFLDTVAREHPSGNLSAKYPKVPTYDVPRYFLLTETIQVLSVLMGAAATKYCRNMNDGAYSCTCTRPEPMILMNEHQFCKMTDLKFFQSHKMRMFVVPQAAQLELPRVPLVLR
jgi:hypothetical protein